MTSTSRPAALGLAALAAGALIAACAAPPRSFRPALPTTLSVQNDHSEDLAVYLDRRGTLIRIGTVASLETRTLRLDPSQVGSGSGLRLVAQPRSARVRHASVTFDLDPGQQIVWRLGAWLRPSSLVVR